MLVLIMNRKQLVYPCSYQASRGMVALAKPSQGNLRNMGSGAPEGKREAVLPILLYYTAPLYSEEWRREGPEQRRSDSGSQGKPDEKIRREQISAWFKNISRFVAHVKTT